MKSPDFQRRIDAAREDGWRVVEDGTERVVMKRTHLGSRLGHLLVGLATVWWSFGLGNLAYAGYEYVQHTEYRVVYAEVSDEEPLESIRRRYARGEIDEAELERRVERLVETEPSHRRDRSVEARSSTETGDRSADSAADSVAECEESTHTGRLHRLRERLR